MSLTAAEKLQAISSSLAQWVSHLQAMYVNADGGLVDHIKWDISRGIVICSLRVRLNFNMAQDEIFKAWHNYVTLVCYHIPNWRTM